MSSKRNTKDVNGRPRKQLRHNDNKVLQEFLESNASKTEIPTNNPEQTANEFNLFYTNRKLKNFDQEKNICCESLAPKDKTLNFLEPTVTEEDFIKIISSLKTGVGLDNVSDKEIKKNKEEYAKKLKKQFAKCVENGYFPEEYKVGRITPVLKEGKTDLVDPASYRPITVLNNEAKVFEKIFYERLESYLQQFQSKKQFAYTAGLDASDANLEFLMHVKNGINNDGYCLAVFLDISKAFDMLSHKKILEKLEKYGVKNNNLKIIESYLTNRKQCVRIKETCSSFLPISIGVPQGSSLGPLLFKIFVNDLLEWDKLSAKVVSYADDVALIYSAKSDKELLEIVENDLKLIFAWYFCNALEVNHSKSAFVNFSGNKSSIDKLKIGANDIQNCVIQKSTSFTHLGLTVSENLTFDDHVQKIASKIEEITNKIPIKQKELEEDFKKWQLTEEEKAKHRKKFQGLLTKVYYAMVNKYLRKNACYYIHCSKKCFDELNQTYKRLFELTNQFGTFDENYLLYLYANSCLNMCKRNKKNVEHFPIVEAISNPETFTYNEFKNNLELFKPCFKNIAWYSSQ